jgi:prefoldin subunit 5
MASSSSKQSESVPVTSLDPQQLINLRSRMEEELQTIASSAVQLNKAGNLFQTSKDAIDELAASEEGEAARARWPV